MLLKQLLFCSLALNLSLCNAGQMGETKKSFDIYVPNLDVSNEISGGAIFLHPTGSADYNVLTAPKNFNVSVPLFSPDWQVQNINLDFSPGFAFNYRRVLANSGSDINVYWAHLRTDNKASNAAPSDHFDGPFYQVGPEASQIRYASGQVKFSFDVVNAEMAKHIHVDPGLKLRVLGGISGLWLGEQINARYSGNPNFTILSKTTSKFSGAGLRLGLDGAYDVYKNLSVVGLFASSLILGTQSPSLNFVGVSGFLTATGIPVGYQSLAHKNYLQLVPAIDGKLGLKYVHPFTSKNNLSIELGYMGNLYINAIQNYVPSNYADNSPGVDTGVIYLKSIIKTVQDFGLNGPYATASLTM